MAREIAALGELEAPVLESLWDSGELSTPVVYERVGKPRGLAYTTVLTILQRLYKKGFAGRREEGRAHVYFALVSREELSRRRGQSLAATLTGLGEAGMAGFLAEAGRLDPAVLEMLKLQLAPKE